jgi:hypothetical protein
MFIHILLELLISSSLGLQALWEISTVASWDGLLLDKLSASLSVVVLCGDDIVINSKVWHKVVLVVFVHISLELLWSSGFGLQTFWEVS